MHFSITDLPVPEPPMTTSEWPLGTDRLMPFSTCFGAEALAHDPRERCDLQPSSTPRTTGW